MKYDALHPDMTFPEVVIEATEQAQFTTIDYQGKDGPVRLLIPFGHKMESVAEQVATLVDGVIERHNYPQEE